MLDRDSRAVEDASAKEKPRKATGRPFQKGDKRAGRPAGVPNKVTRDVQEAARGILESQEYRDNLKARAETGRLPPAVEAMLWHYAYGRPKESIEVTGANGGPLNVSTIARVIVDHQANGSHAQD